MKELQITFERYKDLMQRIDHIERLYIQQVRDMSKQMSAHEKFIKDLQKTIRFQRHLIHKGLKLDDRL